MIITKTKILRKQFYSCLYNNKTFFKIPTIARIHFLTRFQSHSRNNVSINQTGITFFQKQRQTCRRHISTDTDEKKKTKKDVCFNENGKEEKVKKKETEITKKKEEKEEKVEETIVFFCKKENNCKKVDEEKKNIIKKENSDLYKERKEKTIFFESERIIKCISGNGGDGTISFKKYKRKVFGNVGIPNGGRGGNGGSVFLCFTTSEQRKMKKKKRKGNDNSKHMYINNLNELPCVLNASNGEKGKAHQLRGKDGDNIFVHLSKPCFVYELSVDSPKENGKCTNDRGDKHITVSNNNNCFVPIGTTKNHTVETYTGNMEYIYSIVKKNDPTYVKRNKHILNELVKYDKKIKNESFLGFLSEENSCLLLSKGGYGGKGNNIHNVYNYEPGEIGQIKYIKIIYKCISDVCFIGWEKSGKSTLLSSISHKIYTVNNLYMLKKIYYKDNFQITVADFCTFPPKTEQQNTYTKSNNNNNNNKNTDIKGEQKCCINSNIFKYIHLTYLYVIVLDFHRDLIAQFRNIRSELQRQTERIAQMPYFVVINKCDTTFSENIKKAEEAYNIIKKENENAPIFFVSGKCALGIEDFVTCLRNTVGRLKQK